MQPAANFDFPMPKDMRMFLVRRCKATPFFAVITVSEPVHEAVSKILPLVGKRIRTEQGCCGSGLLLIKAFRLRREAHQLIEKVTKLVDGAPAEDTVIWRLP